MLSASHRNASSSSSSSTFATEGGPVDYDDPADNLPFDNSAPADNSTSPSSAPPPTTNWTVIATKIEDLLQKRKQIQSLCGGAQGKVESDLSGFDYDGGTSLPTLGNVTSNYGNGFSSGGDESEEFFSDAFVVEAQFWLTGVVLASLCAAGLVGNVLSFITIGEQSAVYKYIS